MSDRLVIRGDCIKVFDVEMMGAKSFPVQIFVVKVGSDEYPQEVPFELVGKKAGMATEDMVGKVVEVSFDLRGREHNGRYFSSLSAWKVGMVGGSTTTSVENSLVDLEDDPLDDLPF